MTNVALREYKLVRHDDNQNPIAAPHEPSIATQGITPTGASQDFTAFGSDTKFALFMTDVAIYWDIGSSPTASSTTGYLPAGGSLFVGVEPGHLLAVRTV
jgi:hypothetical protein